MATESAVITITPADAEQLLVHNLINRPIRWPVVDRYAEDMRSGNWRVGGSTIDIDEDGYLLNGQHRLHACVRAGVPFTTVMVQGLPTEAQITMDTGLRRRLSDILHWRKESNAVALAAAINLGWRWANGHVPGFAISPTFDQGLAWLERNPSIREAVSKHTAVREVLRAPHSATAAFVHQISLIDYEDTEAFFKRLKDGEQLAAGDPILALRNWMLNQANRKTSGTRPDQVFYLAMMIKGWNAWVTGRSLSNMVWRRGGTSKEEFPVLLNHEGLAVEVRDELVVPATVPQPQE